MPHMSTQFSEIPPDDLDVADSFQLTQALRSLGGMMLVSLLLHAAVGLYLVMAPQGIDLPQGPIIDVTLSAPPQPTPAMTVPKEIATTDSEEEVPAQEPAEPAPSIPPQTAPPTTASPTILAPPTSLMFGISSGSFASFGDGASLREDIRPYFLEILERINTSWQKEGTGVKLTSPAMLLISIERSGELNRVQILQSSGNPAHDRLLSRAVANAAPFPAVPETYTGFTFETPVRFTPPLSLMLFDAAPVIMPPH